MNKFLTFIGGLLGIAVVAGGAVMAVPQSRNWVLDEIAKTSNIYKTAVEENDGLKLQIEELKTQKDSLLKAVSEIDNAINETEDQTTIEVLQVKKQAILNEVKALNDKISELEVKQSDYKTDIEVVSTSALPVLFQDGLTDEELAADWAMGAYWANTRQDTCFTHTDYMAPVEEGKTALSMANIKSLSGNTVEANGLTIEGFMYSLQEQVNSVIVGADYAHIQTSGTALAKIAELHINVDGNRLEQGTAHFASINNVNSGVYVKFAEAINISNIVFNYSHDTNVLTVDITTVKETTEFRAGKYENADMGVAVVFNEDGTYAVQSLEGETAYTGTYTVDGNTINGVLTSSTGEETPETYTIEDGNVVKDGNLFTYVEVEQTE